MSETVSPVPAVLPWAQCTCERCTRLRAERSLADGCPCKECQPGPGIDFDHGAGVRTATRRAEMRLLLKKNDAGTLTPAEEDRLDYLCHDYIYG